MNRTFHYLCVVASILLADYLQSCSGEDFDEPWNEQEFKTRTPRTRSGNEVTYTFPSRDEIKVSQNVINGMNDAWSSTLASLTASSRREFGFYIYVSHTTHALSCGPMISGPLVDCDHSASIRFGQTSNRYTVCGMFHTHTSLDSCSSTKIRLTGPSEADEAAANLKKLPGLLYDYDMPFIQGGYSKDNPKRLYEYGYNQRPSFTE